MRRPVSVKYVFSFLFFEATISVAVRDGTGQLVMEAILETKAATILQFIGGLRGSLHVIFEEGAWAAWLYDLLRPHVDRQTTEVTLNRVQLMDVANPLWLPSDVKVYLRFKAFHSDLDQLYGISYRNDHHYTDYRRYRVSVKMMVPQ